MASRLSIYNGALRLLGDTQLASLNEVSAARRSLDAAWQSAVDDLLSRGMWNFAIRTVELDYDANVEPLFGYLYAFSKPSDWIRTANISQDASFREGYEQYEDETSHWHASIKPLYVRYVSSDPNYGWNVGAWRQPFAKALEAYLAFECGLPISNDRGNRNDLYQLYKTRLAEAKSLDAVDERVRRMPMGRLVRSRLENFTGRER